MGRHETAEPIHLPNWFLVVSATQYKKSNCFNSIRVCPIQDRNRIDLTFCFTYQKWFFASPKSFALVHDKKFLYSSSSEPLDHSVGQPPLVGSRLPRTHLRMRSRLRHRPLLNKPSPDLTLGRRPPRNLSSEVAVEYAPKSLKGAIAN
jgi:hypothetical protein